MKRGAPTTAPSATEARAALVKKKGNETMSKIKTTRQFKAGIDAAFETQKTRDEAKACYDFSRDEFKAAGLDAEAFAKLGLVRVETMSMKLKPKAA